MRIREAQTERYLMDAFGIFYDLPPLVYGGQVWGIRPIANHLRICPDFVYLRGLLVLAGDQTDNAVGQPQSGFWFGEHRRPVELGQADRLGQRVARNRRAGRRSLRSFPDDRLRQEGRPPDATTARSS